MNKTTNATKPANSKGKAYTSYPAPKPFSAPPSAKNPLVDELLYMHTYRRPHNGKTVNKFNAKYLDSLPGMRTDSIGNRIVKIGTAPVLWSSHTDTVHKQDGMQSLAYGGGFLSLKNEKDSNCLGADCTVGVWIMRNMILRGIEGLYIFHHGEEVGGLGSAYIAKQTPDLLDGIRHAIAFDRKGTSSVITHQWDRCASDGFAKALADQLGGGFKPDDGGTFTDTANYTDIVPECTNLSIGYYNAHQSSEIVDISFAMDLLNRVCGLRVADLPVLRKPGEYDPYSYGGYQGGHGYKYGKGFDSSVTRGRGADFQEPNLYDLVFTNPQAAAQLLEDMGVSAAEMQEYADHFSTI